MEHDPQEIWPVTSDVVEQALADAGVRARDVAAIGITNQRETTVLWDRATGDPVHRAIVWQDRRTKAICDRLAADGYADVVREKTGLVLDPVLRRAPKWRGCWKTSTGFALAPNAGSSLSAPSTPGCSTS